MRQIRTLCAVAFALLGGVTSVAAQSATAQAADSPVVVELYTSQGCSSCPPADAFLGQLAGREDVIALALHVDYWDYIGWKDEFASPQYTKRQKGYASVAGRRSIYTPQMIVQGQEHVVGNHPQNVTALINQHAATGPQLDLHISRTGGALTIEATRRAGETTDAVVQLVRYMPEKSVKIRSGENAGRTLTYSNIVTSWEQLGKWDMRAPLSLSERVKGDDPVVVIVQEAGPGRILAAARLR